MTCRKITTLAVLTVTISVASLGESSKRALAQQGAVPGAGQRVGQNQQYGTQQYAAQQSNAQQNGAQQFGAQQYGATGTAPQARTQQVVPASANQGVANNGVASTGAANQSTANQPAGQQANAAQQQRIPLMTAEQAVAAGLATVPKQPFPALSADEQKFLDAVLNVWEKKTESITRYECNFKRWTYDLAIHPTAPSTIAEGNIKYMSPDKGLFKVTQVQTVANKAPKPEYRVDPKRPHGEHWICDGDWVQVVDANEKKAVRTQLPPNMRGPLIHNSPLPFLFGVKANILKQRYWIRPIPVPQGDNSVWLEAWPKRGDDAGNYSRVQVVLSREDTLPRGIIVFMPNWRPEQQFREIYEFSGRNTSKTLWDTVKEGVFRQQFIPMKLPADWNVIEEPWTPPQTQEQPGTPQQRVAQPPSQGATRR